MTQDMQKLQLHNVALAAMSSVNLYETVQALKYSMRGIEFGDAVLISDHRPWYLPRGIRFSKTTRLDSIDAFNYKMVYELHEHIRTDYALIVHADGFVIHPEKWSEDFLQYDYIGAPWPEPDNDYLYRDADRVLRRVGNSVSIRSRRIMEYPLKHDLEWKPGFDGFYNEDIFLCCLYRTQMEADGLTWAPLDVAVRFGREHPIPENCGIEPFSFHKWRGENADYPRFKSPLKRLADITRPIRHPSLRRI